MTKKVGFISDIHVDVNSGKHLTEDLIGYVEYKKLDYLIISGDIAGNYNTVFNFFKTFKKLTTCKAKWIPGNHDLYIHNNKTSKKIYNMYENMSETLSKHPLVINDWVIIGDTGWYDYSYRLKDVFSIEECRKKRYGGYGWADKTEFDWANMFDEEVNDYFLRRIENQINQFKDAKIIVCTHVVPYKKFAEYKGYLEWDYFTAFIGSEKFGQLYDKYDNIKKVVFGHTHSRYNLKYKNKEIICAPLGYCHNEWELTSNDAFSEIDNCIVIKEL